MAIYKRGDTYWYKFMWNGRRIRESAKTGNPKTARQIESARKTELAKGEVGIKDRLPAPTFEEFSERFLTWMNAEHADKESTLRFYRGRVRQLRRYDGFRKAFIDQIDKEMVAEFIKWRCQRTRTYALSKKRGEVGRHVPAGQYCVCQPRPCRVEAYAKHRTALESDFCRSCD